MNIWRSVNHSSGLDKKSLWRDVWRVKASAVSNDCNHLPHSTRIRYTRKTSRKMMERYEKNAESNSASDRVNAPSNRGNSWEPKNITKISHAMGERDAAQDTRQREREGKWEIIRRSEWEAEEFSVVLKMSSLARRTQLSLPQRQALVFRSSSSEHVEG